MGTNEAHELIQSGVVRTPHLFGSCATIKERYLQFVYAEFTADGADHTLKPVFVSHEALWVAVPASCQNCGLGVRVILDRVVVRARSERYPGRPADYQ